MNKPISPEWREVCGNLFLLKPDPATAVIPEHANYNGEGIKQADLILIFYPLQYPATSATVLNNVRCYSNKVLDYGPMMSSAISALLLMREGEKTEGLEMLKAQCRPFLRGPHRLICECRDPENPNTFFLTGAGGVLQALLYGYLEVEIGRTAAIPRVKDVCPDFPN